MSIQHVLQILSPENNATINGDTLTVTGTASGIDHSDPNEPVHDVPVNVRVSVTDAGSRTIRNVDGNWSATFTISSSGSKTIRATSGAVVKTRTVTVELDTEPPVVTIAEPSPDETILQPGPNFGVRISGRATDQSGVEFVEYRLGTSGSYRRASGSSRNWHVDLSGLPIGRHTVRVRAKDVRGNLSSPVSRSFTFVDNGPPEVDITSPDSSPHIVTWSEDGTSVEVSGTAMDPTSGVSSVEWRLGDGTWSEAVNVSGSWSRWRLTAILPAPGLHDIEVRATDTAGNTSGSDVIQIDVAVPFGLDGVGFAAYLEDLMNFTRQRVRQASNPQTTDPQAIERPLLASAFHQPYDRLTESEFSSITSAPVAQVRIAIEVLRSYLSSTGVGDRQVHSYCEAAYHLLLSNLGTSYAEIRIARTADVDVRGRLADRLGIRASDLDKLFLTPAEMTEEKLELIFGLQDTTKDPLSSGEGQAERLTLQLSKLRADWLAQDRAAHAAAEVPTPAIDPDFVVCSDLKSAVPGNVAHDLLFERALWLADQWYGLRKRRRSAEDPQSGFALVVGEVLGALDLAALHQELAEGADIEATLRGSALELDEFLTLVHLEQVAATGTVLEGEWEEVYDILVRVKKRREARAWAEEEVSQNLTLGPAYFVRTESRPTSVSWRSRGPVPWEARRDWEKRLEARIKQHEGLKQAHRALLESTEEVVLPRLREALIAGTDIARRGYPDIDVADWLTQRLSISFKYSGRQRLTRLEQAVETLQDVLLGLRSGRLESLTRMPIGTSLPNWELAVGDGYSESDFDEEWGWMGSFATWRGAMAAFAYPENYLLPTLRDKASWTRAFTELVKSVRRTWQLTPGGAEMFATEYLANLNSPTNQGGDGVSFEIDLTSRLTKEQLLERRDSSRSELQGYFDPETGGWKEDTPSHLLEIFYFVPMLLAQSLQKNGNYLAALDWYQTVYAYELPPHERKIYYGLEAEEELPTQYRRTLGWLLDGLDVFTIAKDRANAHTRFTLLSIARCYLAFADAEFTRETNDSVSLARQLYMTAQDMLDLLKPPPPVAAWTFDADEGNSASNVAGSRHTMTLQGAIWDAEGLNGGALNFESVGATAQVPHAPALALGQDGADFSLAFALNLRGDHTGEYRRFVRKGDAGEQSERTPGIWLSPRDNGLYYSVSTTASWSEGRHSASEVGLNTWTHIALVKQGGLLKLYMDGRLDSEVSLVGDSIGLAVPMQFGEDDVLIDALLDDVRIFDRALSPDSVIALTGFDPFPTNPVVEALRRHAELNLRKLRMGRNIAGMERIRTQPAAAELVIGDGGFLPPPARTLRPTAYRYAALIERAKQLVTIAQQVEANFFAALEKRDAEAYSLLNAQHDVQLTRETVELQDLRVKDADESLVLMELHRDRARETYRSYDSWINAGPNNYERAMLKNYADLKRKRNFLANWDLATTVANAAVTAATAPTFSKPGAMAALAALTVNATVRAEATRDINRLESEAEVNAFNANLERRKDEWRLQRALAHHDIDIAGQQIVQAALDRQIVEQERAIATLQSEQAEAVVEFLNNKFTNVELYEWMSDVLGGVYSYFLQQATALAQLALAQLAFERQERPPAFIRSDYWQAPSDAADQVGEDDGVDRRGLTGSARLLQDIYRLDQHAFETRERKLQLVEQFSLARLAPLEFERFRETGVLNFATPMSLFDRSFPGHYLRLIKGVRVSIVGLIPPTEGIRATLTAAGVSRVVAGDEVFRVTEVRRPPEMIAFTSTSDANGLFELQPDNDLLLPFETMGVDANWQLQLPKAANRFNFDTISDVVFTLEYTALHSADYRQQVVSNLDRSFAAERAYSLKQDFPDLWYDLHNPEALIDEATGDIHAAVTLQRTQFPTNLERLALDHVVLYFVGAGEGASR